MQELNEFSCLPLVMQFAQYTSFFRRLSLLFCFIRWVWLRQRMSPWTRGLRSIQLLWVDFSSWKSPRGVSSSHDSPCGSFTRFPVYDLERSSWRGRSPSYGLVLHQKSNRKRTAQDLTTPRFRLSCLARITLCSFSDRKISWNSVPLSMTSFFIFILREI